jgi:hypothetical protein
MSLSIFIFIFADVVVHHLIPPDVILNLYCSFGYSPIIGRYGCSGFFVGLVMIQIAVECIIFCFILAIIWKVGIIVE